MQCIPGNSIVKPLSDEEYTTGALWEGYTLSSVSTGVRSRREQICALQSDLKIADCVDLLDYLLYIGLSYL
jgi:hypothetical protein